MAAEVVLIALGVFLGLAGEQWRQDAEHREQAHDTLRRFRTELATNRDEVNRVFGYHQTQLAAVRRYLQADESARAAVSLEFAGLKPPFFDRTAWDLAIATQSLAYIDADLAYGLSRIYQLQEFIDLQSRGIAQAMFVRPPGLEYVAFLHAVDVYFGDLIGLEPELLKAYDLVLPELDRVLGDAASG
jgi:hypothetical protein